MPSTTKHPFTGAVLLALFLAARGATAQTPSMRLGPSTDTFADEFTIVGTVRELPDGSVLVTDPAENVLIHVTPGSAPGRPLGRQGQGPLEYQSLWGGLHATRGDTTLIESNAGTRWLFLSGGRLLDVPAPDVGLRTAAGGVIGTDTLGHVLTNRSIRYPVSAPNGGLAMTPLSDSTMLVMYEPGLARADTVARVKASGGPLPLGTGTEAFLFADGWIAIAYPEPYHVEWRTPAARMIRGPTLPWTRAPIDDAQVAFALDRGEARLSRLWAAMRSEWPKELPAFISRPAGFVNEHSGSLKAAPDGRLLVLRTPDARVPDSVRYDIIDRSGNLAVTVMLPIAERIVGFGPKSVYVSVRDADDVQRLRRHAWPAP